MGWKGTLRSMNAASRRAQQASGRRARTLSKLDGMLSTTLSKLATEVQKEIDRIERYEEKICDGPVKTLELSHEPGVGWTTAPFKEQTGQLTYTVSYKPPSQDVSFDPQQLDLDSIVLTPCFVGVSQYFTAIAFEAATAAQEGGRILKLTFPNKPESSRIALASPDGEIFNPLDTSLDGRLFAGTKRRGVVTFEPFDKGLEHFDILFEAKPKSKGADPETLRIRVTSPTMKEEMATCLSQPSILEQMTTQFREIETKYKTDITTKVDEVKKKASSGCLVVVVLWLTAVSAGIVVAVMQFR